MDAGSLPDELLNAPDLGLHWEKLGAHADHAIRAVLLNCPRIDHQLDPARCFMAPWPGLQGFVLLRVAGPAYADGAVKECYGFWRPPAEGSYDSSHFHPLNGTDTAFELARFAAGAGEEASAGWTTLKAAFDGHAQRTGRVYLMPEDQRLRVYLPKGEWKPLSGHTPGTRDARIATGEDHEWKERLAPGPDDQLWLLDLPFYTNIALVEVLTLDEEADATAPPAAVPAAAAETPPPSAEEGPAAPPVIRKKIWKRGYVLLHFENGQRTRPHFMQALGMQTDVYRLAKFPGNRLVLDTEARQLAYLRFFFFARGGRHGRFFLYDGPASAPLLAVPPPTLLTEAVAVKDPSSEGKEGEAPESGAGSPVPVVDAIRNGAPKVLARDGTKVVVGMGIFFKTSYFEANATFELERGETSLSGETLQKEDLATSEDRQDSSWLKQRIKKRKAEGPRTERHGPAGTEPKPLRTVTAQEFLRELLQKGTVRDLRVEEPFLLALTAPSASDGQEKHHGALRIINCRFQGRLVLGNIRTGLPLSFADCHFMDGFDGAERTLEAPLAFTNCLWEVKEGSLVCRFRGSKIEGSLSIQDGRFVGVLDARGLQVGGDLALQGCTWTLERPDGPLDIPLSDLLWLDMSEKETLRFSDDVQVRSGSSFMLWLDKACIEGDLYLQGRYGAGPSLLAGPLSAKGMTVEGKLFLGHLLCNGGADLSSSKFVGGAQFGAGAEGPWNVLVLNGRLDLTECNAQGSFSMEGLRLAYTTDTEKERESWHLHLSGSCFDRDVNMVQLHTGKGQRVSMDLVRCQGTVRMFDSEIGAAVDVSFAEIRGYLYMLGPVKVDGRLDLGGSTMGSVALYGLRVNGTIRAVGATFNRFECHARLEKDPAIAGKWPTPFYEYCTAYGLLVKDSTIKGRLSLHGLRLQMPEDFQERVEVRREAAGYGLKVESSTIESDLRFFDEGEMRDRMDRYAETDKEEKENKDHLRAEAYRTQTWGGAAFKGLIIGGEFDLRNLHVEGRMEMEDIEVGRDLLMDHAMRRPDELGTEGQDDRYVGGLQTRCAWLSIEKLKCGGDIKLSGLKAEEDVRLEHAEVVGNVLFQQEQEDVYRATEYPTGCAEIGGFLDLSELKASRLKLSQGIFTAEQLGRRPGHDASGEENSLRRVSVGQLDIIGCIPPFDLGHLQAERWSFRPLADGASSASGTRKQKEKRRTEDHLRILEQGTPFDRTAWVNVERSLRGQGLTSSADRIYRRMSRKGLHDEAKWQRPIKRVLGEYIGYGTRWGIPLVVCVGLWLLLGLLLSDVRNIKFDYGEGHDGTVAKEGVALDPPTGPSIKDTVPPRVHRAPVLDAAAPGLGGKLAHTEGHDSTVMKEGAALVQRSRPGVKDTIPLQVRRAPVLDTSAWGFGDAMILSLRHCVPIIPLAFHEEFAASDEDAWIGKHRLGISPEALAIIVEVLCYLSLSILILTQSVRLIRGKNE